MWQYRLIALVFLTASSSAQVASEATDATMDTQSTVTPSADTPEPTPPKRQFRYTYGFKIDSPNLSRPKQELKLTPVLGFTYGPWRIGTNSDPESFLGFTAFRREPTVGYQAVDSEKFRILIGARIQNITTGEAINLLESGRYTLRGRLQAYYKLPQAWTLGSELTQDLMNRGDGTTLTLGASKAFEISGRQSLNFALGTTWATAKHWRTPYLTQPTLAAQANQLRAGFGSLGAGVTYRKELTRHLIWTCSLAADQALGQLQDLNGSRVNFSLQTGLLWFGQR